MNPRDAVAVAEDLNRECRVITGSAEHVERER
jgi:hypothetical protein